MKRVRVMIKRKDVNDDGTEVTVYRQKEKNLNVSCVSLKLTRMIDLKDTRKIFIQFKANISVQSVRDFLTQEKIVMDTSTIDVIQG